MKAVAWMDTFNFILGVGTLWVLVVVLVVRNFDGGMVGVYEAIKNDPVSVANLGAPGATGYFTIPGIINQALTASVATIVWPHIYSRCYIAKSKKNFEVMAWGLPLGAEKCVIERDKVLDLLDEIKAQFPTELAEAKRLVAARSEFIANAKREAESIRKVAEEHARQMIDEQEIIRSARAKSNEMIATAEAKSSELRRVANEYADDALKRTEEAIEEALNEVRHSRANFRSVSASMNQGSSNQ